MSETERPKVIECQGWCGAWTEYHPFFLMGKDGWIRRWFTCGHQRIVCRECHAVIHECPECGCEEEYT